MRRSSTPAALTAALLAAALLSACTHTRPHLDADWAPAAQAPAPDTPRTHRVYLIGNTGADLDTDGALDRLAAELAALTDAEEEDATVVYLGDVLPGGMPDSLSAGRAEAEAHVRRQLAPLTGFGGRVVVLAGDRDWTGGASALRRTEAFVEATLHALLDDEADDPDVDNTFRPDDGFPGPDDIELADGLRLFALNTGWWLTDEDRPFGDTGEYDLIEAVDMLNELEDRLAKRDDDDVLVVGHHPPRSNGRHGGAFPLVDHVFPLRRAVGPAGYLVPLPLVGSAYPLYHRYVGTEQDLAGPRYAALNDALLRLYRTHANVFVAGAHDYSLQHFPLNTGEFNRHVVVSGAGVRAEPVASGGTAFTAGVVGLLALDFYADGAVWLSALGEAAHDRGAATPPLARYRLREGRPDFVPEDDPPDAPPVTAPAPVAAEPTPGDTVRAAVNPGYDRLGGFGRLFLGQHWRDAWAQPVDLRVLDVGTAGRDSTAVEPVQRSGSGQTYGLRLAEVDDDERTYALRSVDKEAARRWPEELRGGAAEAAVQDQTSAFHPYGALVVPAFAKAVGVFHTEPRLVYVPDDPRLGAYQAYMADRIALLEERPDEDMSDLATMGFSEDVTSTRTLWEETTGDVDHVADQAMFARARLLDLWLGDHDRHDDQWRWAEFEPGDLDSTLTGDARTEGKVYRPVPRDRDYVFMRMDGVFPWLAKRFFTRQYQGFGTGYGYLRGSLRNGLGLTRRFTNRLAREDWIAAARQMQAALPDSLIDAALRTHWPPEIYALHGGEIARRLRARRDQLEDVAAEVYANLAAVVDVVGSDKHERFAVTRRPDGTVDVAVFKTKKDGEVVEEVYRRIFHDAETDEVRLYGLGGRDRFEVTGEGSGLLVRVIGGPGADRVDDTSRAAGLGNGTLVYDTVEGVTIGADGEVGRRLSVDPRVLDYDRSRFAFNTTMPLLDFRANEEDGLFVGGGVLITQQGFRKHPYARQHRLAASVAAATGAFYASYDGHYVRALDGLGLPGFDLHLEADAATPNNVRTYFGLGNETPNTDAVREFYQARLAEVRASARAVYPLAPGARLSIGPRFEYVNVRQDEDRFVGTPQAGISSSTFEDQWFAGLAGGAELDGRNRRVNPTQGFHWTAEGAWNVSLSRTTDSYARLESALAFYLPLVRRRPVTLALRVGGAHNIGDFPFYAANAIGSRDALRGYRRTRFAGRTSFYQNAEVRAHVYRVATYLAPVDVGVLGFVDNGRVWTEADDLPREDGTRPTQSFFEGYHQGYGGGLWASVYDQFVLAGTVGLSDEDTVFEIGLGFKF